jgi:hypothetical protein
MGATPAEPIRMECLRCGAHTVRRPWEDEAPRRCSVCGSLSLSRVAESMPSRESLRAIAPSPPSRD